VPVYTPPDRPYPSLDPVADVVRAYEWTAQFFTARAPIIRFVGNVVRSGISRIG
jgi:hypothetical protein